MAAHGSMSLQLAGSCGDSYVRPCRNVDSHTHRLSHPAANYYEVTTTAGATQFNLEEEPCFIHINHNSSRISVTRFCYTIKAIFLLTKYICYLPVNGLKRTSRHSRQISLITYKKKYCVCILVM